MTLEEAREAIGAGVVYRGACGRAEDGVITSVGTRFVFVRYAGDHHGIATRPEDLTFLAARPGGAS